MTVQVTGGVGTPNYQWYELTTGLIPNETSDTYIPPSDSIGTFEYYCIIQQGDTSIDCWVSTDTCTIIVTAGPSVQTPFQNDSVCLDGIVNPLIVTPGNSGGTPTYQWFVNGTIITTNGNNSTYQVPTSIAGTYIYECELTFPFGGCDPVTSDSITIVVMPDPIIATQPDSLTIICQGGCLLYTSDAADE